MSKTARFQSAVPRARPAGSRVIEAYSLKLGRRLQCFGEAVFEQWIRLEVDPTIQTFCERPLDVNFVDGVLRVDFWVRQGDREMLLVMDDACEARSTIIDGVEMAVRIVPPAELSASKMWTDNWQRMLVAITCSRKEIPPSLQQSILKFVAEPMQLSRIEQEFSTGDPTPVRAAVFCLLHAGKLKAPQLHAEELSFLTSIHPVKPLS